MKQKQNSKCPVCRKTITMRDGRIMAHDVSEGEQCPESGKPPLMRIDCSNAEIVAWSHQSERIVGEILIDAMSHPKTVAMEKIVRFMATDTAETLEPFRITPPSPQWGAFLNFVLTNPHN